MRTHDNLFGMFIHWGFYSLTGLQEQAFARYDLPREEYAAAEERVVKELTAADSALDVRVKELEQSSETE